MRKGLHGPCALVAGDEPIPAPWQGAVTILLWLGVFLLEGAELSALFAILAGAGLSLDSGLRGSRLIRLDLRLSLAVGEGAGRE